MLRLFFFVDMDMLQSLCGIAGVVRADLNFKLKQGGQGSSQACHTYVPRPNPVRYGGVRANQPDPPPPSALSAGGPAWEH